MDKFRRDRAEERRETTLSVFLGCNLISDGGIISGESHLGYQKSDTRFYFSSELFRSVAC